MDFATWLVQERRRTGMTQRQLAKKSGLSAGYVALLERGTSAPPPLNTWKRLARAVGLQCEGVHYLYLATRLRTWLKREGYAAVSEAALVEIAKKIEDASR